MSSSYRFYCLLIAAAAVLLAGCRRGDPVITITDISREERLSIGKLAGQGPVKRLRLRIEGRIDGTAQLVLFEENRPRHVMDLTGDVDVRWNEPWTEDRARLVYTPGTVTGGALRVQYRFVE